MAHVKVNPPQRFDPYKNFKFRIKWDGRQVAGFTKCSGLKAGGPRSIRKSPPGHTEFEAITLTRGVTYDPELKFVIEQAAFFPLNDIHIEVYNEAGQLTITYKVFRCWVSECLTPDMAASANALAIEYMKLGNEGVESLLSENPLQALLRVIAEQANALADNVQQLYDDQFIETCEDWVVPYIGDLIGWRAARGRLVSAVIAELLKERWATKREPSKKRTKAQRRSTKLRRKSKRKASK